MMLVTLFLIIALCLAAWFWLDNMKTKEIALAAARRYCQKHTLQLLDDTIALASWRLRFKPGVTLMRIFKISVYDVEHERKLIVPLYMRNHQVEAIGQEAARIVRLSDYRDS